MSSKLAGLPPSPFAKNRNGEWGIDNGERGNKDYGRRMINALRNGHDQMRTRTAGKGFASTPDVTEEDPMHRSAIEQLQSLDAPPAKTQHLINTKRTFEELHIRKSNSFDRDRIELSLSSDYIDFQSENTQLKRRIQDLQKQISQFAQADQHARLEVLEWQRRLEESQGKLHNAESQCNRARILITQYQSQIDLKQREINVLRQKLGASDRTVKEEKNINSVHCYEMQALKNHFQTERQSIIQAYQQHLETLQAQTNEEIEALSYQFNNAKQLGQRQIDSLVQTLQMKEKENAFLRNTINQGLFLKNSTHTSEVLSYSKTNNQSDAPQQKFMTRFKNFSKMIDRKLFSSCDDRESNIFYSKVLTNPPITDKAKRTVQDDTHQRHQISTNNRQNHILHHQHHFSAR